MPIKIETNLQQSKKILKIRGSLDYSTADFMSDITFELISGSTIVFDFSGLEFIDSSGVGVILGLIYEAKNRGSSIKLRNLDTNTKGLFERIGVFRVLEALLRK